MSLRGELAPARHRARSRASARARAMPRTVAPVESTARAPIVAGGLSPIQRRSSGAGSPLARSPQVKKKSKVPRAGSQFLEGGKTQKEIDAEKKAKRNRPIEEIIKEECVRPRAQARAIYRRV